MIEFILNDKLVIAVSPPATVLLDYLRRELKLTGTKEGCREGDCGACTVLIGSLSGNTIKYKNVNSCLVPLGDLHGKHVVTIEGLNSSSLSVVQDSFVSEGGTQCGFCTPGFIVSLTGYFLNNSKPDFDGAVEFLSGNICRCTGYAGIKRGIEKSIAFYGGEGEKNIIEHAVKAGFVPPYFAGIPKLLKKIKPIQNKVKKDIPLISGGTDIYVQRRDEAVYPEANLISGLETLKGIKKEGGQIIIGAASAIEEIKSSALLAKYIPGWQEYLNLFGSLPIRNRATAAGNIVNASPIGDFTNILLALGAGLNLAGGKRKRHVPLKNFYKGYKLIDKEKNEIIESISFPLPSKDSRFNYEKVSKRKYLDIASVNTSILIETKKNIIKRVNISAGGVAPVPVYLTRMCEHLEGGEISTRLINEGVYLALTEISPITDARGSAEYKKLLLRQLLYAHFIRLFPESIEIERLL